MGKKNPLAIVAFGGNALIPDANHLAVHDQYPIVREISKTIADMVESGWNVLITHGNGPQVGVVMRRTELTLPTIAPLTLDYAVSNTQGTIGYMFSVSLFSEYRKRGIQRQALAMIGQTLVDRNDPAFANPTKPIGSWYAKEEAEELARKNNWTIVEDAGRGWRRIVPSPRPVGIVQLPAIRALMEQNFTVVTVGGGGIPVIMNDEGELVGVEAVIDKDFASSLLARELEADLLIFPTGVERVAVRFNKSDQRWLDQLTLAEAERYCQEGEFPKGSMLPTIRALMEFVSATGNAGVITSLPNLDKALRGEAGTRLIP